MSSNIIYNFKNYLAEAETKSTKKKATKKKATKKANEQDTKGWDYEDHKLFNNLNPGQLHNGVSFEIRQNPKLHKDEAIDIVVKKLGEDPTYYMKNAAFQVDGIGYEESKLQEEPKGEHKSSGYGDIKENNMKKSEQLKELLEEAVAGIPSIGNPFAERKQTAYETKFEAYLSENARTDAEEEGYLDGMKDEKKDKKKEAKKEGRMGMKDIMKEAKRLGEVAKKRVEAKIYERAIAERKSALMVNEDESISEFINQSAVQSVQKEVALLEKKLMEVTADANTMG